MKIQNRFFSMAKYAVAPNQKKTTFVFPAYILKTKRSKLKEKIANTFE